MKQLQVGAGADCPHEGVHCSVWSRQLQVGEASAEQEKTLEKMIRAGLTPAVKHENKLNYRFIDPGNLPPPVLQFREITFGYPGCEPLYEKLDFGVDLDSRIALVGPNGAGKSTLLKLMTGDLMPTLGDIRPHSHLRIGYFNQHFADAMPMDNNALDWLKELYPDESRESHRSWLGRYGVTGGEQTQTMGHLSNGQQCRIMFAIKSKTAPHLWLLDEPTNHMDMEAIDSLAVAINNFSGGMVLVSHDMRLISQVAEQIWLCDPSIKSLRRYEGDIADFKLNLRREMGLQGRGDASTAKREDP